MSPITRRKGVANSLEARRLSCFSARLKVLRKAEFKGPQSMKVGGSGEAWPSTSVPRFMR